jgi:uncharacterized protein with FMN-binding domain
MKKALSLILAVMMLLSLMVPAYADDAQTATGKGTGIDGEVIVEVKADANTIYEVTVLQQNETPGIGSVAVEKLPGAIVEANSIEVDGISGATATSNAVLSAAAEAYLKALGVDVDLSVWAAGQGYVKGEDYRMVPAVDAVTSATESGQGGINFGDVDLSDELKKELILDYLKGAEGNYREMYQIATSFNNTPTIGSVEYVLDPEDMTLFGSSETNTAKLNNMMLNPQVDLYWTRQIRAGDVCSEAAPVLPSYFMSYGVEITGTYVPIVFSELSEDEIPVYVAKAHYYFETLDTTAQLAAMDDDALYEYLCASPMNFYQIVPSRIVVTSPWFLNVYDSGYARQFVDEDLQAALLAAVQEAYPEAESLTTLDFATFTATGLKTQQTLAF